MPRAMPVPASLWNFRCGSGNATQPEGALTLFYRSDKRALRHNRKLEVEGIMTRPLVRFAMTGALAMGLAFAQTSTGQTGQTPANQANPAPTPAQRARHIRQSMHQRLMAKLALSPAQQQQAKA